MGVVVVGYLPVDEAHDSGFQPHAHREAAVHVLMVQQRLQAGQQEKQRSKQETFPHGGVFVPHETEQQTELR